MPPLTALEIRQEAARRTDKTRTLSDGNGLNLIVPASAANGNPRWVLRYTKDGRSSMRGLGRYPEVSLLDARKAALQLRAQIQTSGPPLTAQQQRALIQATEPVENVTFAVAAQRWFDATSEHLTPKHRAQVISSLKAHAFPTLGKKPLASIKPGDIETVMRRMMAPSNPLMETASRVFQRINAVFEYAGRQEWCANNPASVLRGELTRLKKQVRRHNPEGHHAAILDDVGIAGVLQAVAAYRAQQTRAALEVIIYTGCRSGELRQATWAEIG
ncbi:MAG: integrase arm-type DNA-binding domain-containing protein [Betaproteobacteria bacterium]|nr:integrase arm-type DNA-binding domain-containing protein [Betaproteobacteria bacterium]MDE2124952.1 integrase arm-type DNA-binding domain-containing protein [Betaproteobacteria bacterium]MDE2186993.1 integrase arm-type DNA-binding domain-containing protein [Betaproteobacteria bacterium]MDE2324635.1 integrase arm-type DNA-binding domain-containing protein [Betaproteobacteria bacterium]